MKAAADLVVDPAHRHAVQRMQQGLSQRGVVPARIHQQLKIGRDRELRSAATESAVHLVETREESEDGVVHFALPDRLRLRERPESSGHVGRDLISFCQELRSLAGPLSCDLPQECHESRLWKISAAEKWLERLRFEKHGHRPAASPRQRLDRRHVNIIHIRALFTIDLDRDEVLVHVGGNLLVFKALSLHHMTPITRGVADADEDRLVLASRGFKRLRSPRIPVHRVMGMLQQVGAGFVDQAIRMLVLAAGGIDEKRHVPGNRLEAGRFVSALSSRLRRLGRLNRNRNRNRIGNRNRAGLFPWRFALASPQYDQS